MNKDSIHPFCARNNKKISGGTNVMYIEKINGPEDVKKLSNNELTSLAAEMRQVLLKRASIHGGHFGPNFGMVEATIALHYVFRSEEHTSELQSPC